MKTRIARALAAAAIIATLLLAGAAPFGRPGTLSTDTTTTTVSGQ